MIKKLQIALFTVFGCMCIFAPTTVLATDPIEQVCEINPNSSVCQSSTTENPIFGPTGIITRITKILGFVVGVAAVIMMIINGFRFVISNGNPENVSKAKNGIIFAIIGLLVALFAEAIALFVLQRL
ncbi:MAG TPA: hypothetical protein PKB09_00445 [Candidatus Saccharibacteria bacterium]|nr:hypothetical protein [Candidatus Saccharibacteria bacterium]